MMFRGGGSKGRQMPQSVRPRQIQPTVDASFRRNAAFVSKSQRDKAAQHRTATERQLEQKRQQAHRRLKHRIIIGVIIGMIIFAGSAFRLRGVEVSSNASSKLSATERTYYQEGIQKAALEHTVLGQVWLLDTDALQAAVLGQYPEIDHIALKKQSPLSQKVSVAIRFRIPVFTWIDASGARQYVDTNGVLFTKNLDPSVQEGSLTTVEDQSGAVLAAGDTVLTKEIVAFIGQLHAQIPSLYKGANIEAVIIPTATREVQVRVAGKPYTIRFSSARLLSEQISELRMLLQHLEESRVAPGAVIDMRVPHKAFYR